MKYQRCYMRYFLCFFTHILNSFSWNKLDMYAIHLHEEIWMIGERNFKTKDKVLIVRCVYLNCCTSSSCLYKVTSETIGCHVKASPPSGSTHRRQSYSLLWQQGLMYSLRPVLHPREIRIVHYIANQFHHWRHNLRKCTKYALMWVVSLMLIITSQQALKHMWHKSVIIVAVHWGLVSPWFTVSNTPS